ncbi:MAG: hypothetical protein M3133_01335, partial [Actinomycetota bacterium]|nr:hypothetical protein [Actinomycetota bacterium]
MRHRRPLLTVMAAALFAVAACVEGPAPKGQRVTREKVAGPAELQPKGKPAGTLPFEKLHHAADHMGEWTLELVHAIDTARDLSGRAHGRAVTLLARLDFLLREHVVLATYATEAAVSGDHPVEPALHALEANTDELRRELFELFNTELAERFKAVWQQHLDALIAYGRALGERDAALEREARGNLDKFVRDFADYLADLTNDKLEEAEVRAALRRHVDTLIAIVDAQAEGPAGWYEHVEAALHEVAVFAEALAADLSQQAVLAGDTNTESAILRAELGGALADSVFFTAYATDAELGDQAAAVAATEHLLESNTRELE